MLTARFYDGDPTNNFFCRDRIRFDEADPTSGLHPRPGLQRHLDHPAHREPLRSDYHGYDWTRIDPRLESPDATYQDLIDAAHARGIKIIQDVVINHSCQYGIRGKVWIDHLPIKYYVPQGSEPGRIDHGPYQRNLGNLPSRTGTTSTIPSPRTGTGSAAPAIRKALNP